VRQTRGPGGGSLATDSRKAQNRNPDSAAGSRWGPGSATDRIATGKKCAATSGGSLNALACIFQTAKHRRAIRRQGETAENRNRPSRSECVRETRFLSIRIRRKKLAPGCGIKKKKNCICYDRAEAIPGEGQRLSFTLCGRGGGLVLVDLFSHTPIEIGGRRRPSATTPFEIGPAARIGQHRLPSALSSARAWALDFLAQASGGTPRAFRSFAGPSSAFARISKPGGRCAVRAKASAGKIAFRAAHGPSRRSKHASRFGHPLQLSPVRGTGSGLERIRRLIDRRTGRNFITRARPPTRAHVSQ